MIPYRQACGIANGIREKKFSSFKYVHVVDIADHWSCSFSAYAPGDPCAMTLPPSFFVYKESGNVEWYTIPLLENHDLLESGSTIGFDASIARLKSVDWHGTMYREYDMPRTKEIEKYRAMSEEERDALLEEILKEVREERKREEECNHKENDKR